MLPVCTGLVSSTAWVQVSSSSGWDIDTFAGGVPASEGLAPDAFLSNPSSVALDAPGNVRVLDIGPSAPIALALARRERDLMADLESIDGERLAVMSGRVRTHPLTSDARYAAQAHLSLEETHPDEQSDVLTEKVSHPHIPASEKKGHS